MAKIEGTWTSPSMRLLRQSREDYTITVKWNFKVSFWQALKIRLAGVNNLISAEAIPKPKSRKKRKVRKHNPCARKVMDACPGRRECRVEDCLHFSAHMEDDDCTAPCGPVGHTCKEVNE